MRLNEKKKKGIDNSISYIIVYKIIINIIIKKTC